MMKRLLILALLLTPLDVAGQVINAASCSSTDVQTAFNSVISSTTTVNIPSGTCSWTTQVTLTVPSGNTSLTVQGQSSIATNDANGNPATFNDVTIITDNYTTQSGMLVINTNSNASGIVRFTGITYQAGTGPPTSSGWQIISLGSGSEQFRFDHNHPMVLSSSGQTFMRINGCTPGVADHNLVDLTSNNNGIQEWNLGSCYSDSLGEGDQAWAHPTGFGTASAFFLENNTFNNGFANDCYMGSYVFRFNTFNENANTASAIQTHPTGGAGRIRGCRSTEIYKNTMNVTSFMNAAVFFSSGPGMIWGNPCASSSASGGVGCKQWVQIESIRTSNVTYTQTATPNGWGYCGTAFNGTGSNWDGSNSTSSGYPCIDQPGRGQGDLLVNDFPNTTNNATGCTSSSACAYPRQAVEPVYVWSLASQEWQPVPNNTSNYVGIGVGSADLTQNVDFYTGADNSGNLISFTGATGVGVGTRASRPASTTNGVAYWATTDSGSGVTWNNGAPNSGCLDKVVSGAWVNCFYTPYAYPHPLISGGVAAVPTYTPGTGTYTAPQTVTISSTTSGATICYTTDGSTPTANGAGTCTHGTTYAGTITVSTTQTVKAVASKSGTVDSSVGTAAFTINQAPAPVMFLGPIQMIGKVTIP